MTRFVKTVFATALVAIASQSYAATSNSKANISISPEERAKIEQVVHQYLITKPEVLVEAMQVLQKRQMDEAQQTIKQTQQNVTAFATPLFHQNDDPVVGNPNGTITIVEFFDYQCPHCVDMAPVMDAIIKANPNVRVVYKEFPIRGPMSEYAARAALAANLQGKYHEFSNALLTSGQPLSQDSIMQIAKANGLDVDKLKKDMDSDKIKKQLQSNIKLAQNLKLFGTPALFIGKTNAKGKDAIVYVPGQMTPDQLQAQIDKAK